MAEIDPSDLLESDNTAPEPVQPSAEFIQSETERIEKEFNERVKQRKLETIKTAIDVLKENNRHKPISERDITEEDILTLANTLGNFIDN